MGGNNSGWGDNLMDLALMWWASRGQNGSTPNFYNIPLTPEQKRWEDARWDLYQRGGSDQAKAVGSAGMQFLNGLQQGPSNFSFMSPAMQGQTFAGGFQMPKIDISRFPMPQPGSGNARPTPTGPGRSVYEGPDGRPTSDEIDVPWAVGGGMQNPAGGRRVRHKEVSGGGSGDMMYRDIYDIMSQPGGGPSIADRENWFPTTGGPRDPNRPGGGGAQTQYGDPPGLANIPEDVKSGFLNWLRDYMAKNPNWKQEGTSKLLTAAGAAWGGPLGGAVGRFVGWGIGKIMGWGNTPTTPPTPTTPTTPPTNGGFAMPGDN